MATQSRQAGQPATGSRLVLHLSGAWQAKHDASIRGDDICLRMPGLRVVSRRGEWRELPASTGDGLEALRDQYMGLFSGADDLLATESFTSLVNDQFIYGVIPIAAALTEIARLVDRYRPDEIILFHAGVHQECLPATGFATLESQRGSRDVLGSLVAAAVLAADLPARVRGLRLKGDLLSRPWRRRAALRLASSVILARYAMSMIWQATRHRAEFDRNGIHGLVLIRSSEHARHAARIFHRCGGIAALVTPQFTQGNLEQIRTLCRDRFPIATPRVASVLRGLRAALGPARRLKHDRVQAICVGPFQFRASLRELHKDYDAVRFYAFHKALLEHDLRAFPSVRFTAGFEVQGPFAWIEGCVPRQMGKTTRALQPVLVQNRPLPVFPFASCFLADSKPNQEALARIGGRSLGAVVYKGPLAEVRPVASRPGSLVIGYFSQPYEIENNLRIVEALCQVAESGNGSVDIRLHPRDEARQYEAILRRYPRICRIADPQPMEDFLDTLDISVTRTSSVTKEAIARGCLTINVLLSPLDRSLKADYLEDGEHTPSHIVRDLDALSELIGDRQRLAGASVALQAALFGEKTFSDLVDFACR